jgi:hypothetical protein
MKITREIATKVLTVVDAGLVKGIGVAKPGKMCVEAAVCFALGLPHGDNPQCVAPPLRALKIRLNDSAWSSNQVRAAGLRRLALAQLGSAGALDEKEFLRRIVDNALGSTVPRALRLAASIQKNAKHKAALIDAAARCECERSREAAIDAAARCECERSREAAIDAQATSRAAYAAYAADAAAYAANAAAYAADAAAYADAAADAADAAAAAAAAAAANAADAAADAADAAADAAAYAAASAKFARDKLLADYAEEVVQILIAMNAPGSQWLDLAPIPEAA